VKLAGAARVLLVLALFMASVLVVQPPGASDSVTLPLEGGEIRVAVQRPPELNPLAASAADEESWSIIDLVYDSLARPDPDTLLPTPWMALGWDVSGDVVTVRIRPGIQWHGGGELVADDVLYTLTDPAGLKSTSRFSGLLSGLTGTALSPYEVEFDLATFANRGRFLQEILTLPILPQGFTASSAPNGTGPYVPGAPDTHTLTVDGEYLVANASEGQEFAALHYAYVHDGLYDLYNGDLQLLNNNTTSVGFDLISIQDGTVQFTPPLEHNMSIRAYYSFDVSYQRLDAFDGFFKPGLPYLDAVNLTFFPDDPATPEDEAVDGAIKAMIDKQADFISWPVSSVEASALRWEGTPDEASLKKALDPAKVAHVSLTFSPSFSFLYLGMNNQVTPLDDPTLRQAIARVLDKDLYHGSIETDTVIADSLVVPANAYWYNNSVPRYRVPKGEVGGRPESILDDVNLMLDLAGYMDRNNDGWRDLPDPPYLSFNFTLFSISDAVDPLKAIIGSNVRDNLHKVGINTNLVAKTPEEIQARIDANQFDMYIQRITVKADPSFMVDLLHSTKGSRNYVNADDPALDAILDAMEASVDQTARRQWAMDAQGWVAVNAHLAPIHHYDVLNAHEKAAYQGWVSMVGGIHNYWTYLYLNQIPSGRLVVEVSTYETSFVGGESADVAVRITDQEGFPVSGVQLTVSSSAGGVMNLASTTTDANGVSVDDLSFEAEATDVVRDVTITVLAEKPAYASAVGSWRVTVHPATSQMDVAVTVWPLRIGSEDEAAIYVNVTDRDTGLPVPNATVTITVKPSGIGDSIETPAGSTGATGSFTTSITASVAIESTLTITATVSKEGYEDQTAKASLMVERRSPVPSTPGLDTVALIGVVALLAVAYARWQRRRRE
jgi:ABC-type transport system substrate-binding protein